MPAKQTQYKQVQFIAHCLYTGPRVTEWKAGVGGIPTPSKQEYIGLSSDAEDMKARVALVKAAITEAKKKSAPSDEVLKVFMLPEFFFRGKNGAYELDKDAYIALRKLIFDHKNRASAIKSPQFATYQTNNALLGEDGLLKQLQKLVSDPQWRDWLFVFGTIVGVYPSASTPKEVVNFALVQEGGYHEELDMVYQEYCDLMKMQGVKRYEKFTAFAKGKDDLFAHLVQKKNLSAGDFIKSATTSGVNSGYLAETVKPAANESDDISNLVFKMKDLTFGLEICTDHFQSVLKKSQPSTRIDIQLVPSAGSTITDPASIVLQNGYIFNCDGAKLERKVADKKLQMNTPVYNEPQDEIIKHVGDIYQWALQGEPKVGDDDGLYQELGELMDSMPEVAQLYKSHSQVIGVTITQRKGVRRAHRVTINQAVNLIFAGDAGYLHVYQPADFPPK